MKILKEPRFNLSILDLAKQHKEEIGEYDIQVVNPDIKAYNQKILNGSADFLGVYSDDGDVIGYGINIYTTSLHYKDLIYAFNDVIYISPSYRKGMAGVKLVKALISAAEAKKAHIYTMTYKVTHPFPSLLKRFGFKHSEESWSKQLRGLNDE